jgi:hypothetical protein
MFIMACEKQIYKNCSLSKEENQDASHKGRDNSVAIVTGYDLDGRGSKSGRIKIFLFSTASRPVLGPTQPPIQWVP